METLASPQTPTPEELAQMMQPGAGSEQSPHAQQAEGQSPHAEVEGRLLTLQHKERVLQDKIAFSQGLGAMVIEKSLGVKVEGAPDEPIRPKGAFQRLRAVRAAKKANALVQKKEEEEFRMSLYPTTGGSSRRSILTTASARRHAAQAAKKSLERGDIDVNTYIEQRRNARNINVYSKHTTPDKIRERHGIETQKVHDSVTHRRWTNRRQRKLGHVSAQIDLLRQQQAALLENEEGSAATTEPIAPVVYPKPIATLETEHDTPQAIPHHESVNPGDDEYDFDTPQQQPGEYQPGEHVRELQDEMVGRIEEILEQVKQQVGEANYDEAVALERANALVMAEYAGRIAEAYQKDMGGFGGSINPEDMIKDAMGEGKVEAEEPVALKQSATPKKTKRPRKAPAKKRNERVVALEDLAKELGLEDREEPPKPKTTRQSNETVQQRARRERLEKSRQKIADGQKTFSHPDIPS